MNVRAGDEPEWNSPLVEDRLQVRHRSPDEWTRVIVHPWADVRRASEDGRSVFDRHARHLQSRVEIDRTIVDARKQVTV